MKYNTRIKKVIKDGEYLYQPQVKRNIPFSFILNWKPLSMLIFHDSEKYDLVYWSENKSDAIYTLNRFLYNVERSRK